MPATRAAMLAVWIAFIVQLLFVATVIPPWQNPDEPSHFAVIRTFAKDASIDLSRSSDLDVEAEILASMARNGWWKAYDQPVPEPLPSRFLDIQAEGHLNRAMFGEPALYYALAARLCRLIGAETVLEQYFSLRFTSLLMSLATFGFIIVGAREWFDDRVALCTGALVALVPQFVIISIAVSPDPLVFLACAAVWWQAGRLFAHKGVVVPITLMAVAAVVALLAKRVGSPLIVQAGLLVAIAFVASRKGRKLFPVSVVATLGLLVAGAVLTLVIFGRQGELAAIWRLWEPVIWGTFARWPYHRATFYVRFTRALFQSAYLAGGWARFMAPPAVTVLALTVGTLGMLRGVTVAARSADLRLRVGTLCAALFVLVQIVAIYLYGIRFYSPTLGAQGRFLFGAIGPAAALCAIGLVQWPSPRMRLAVAGSAVGLMAILALISWTTVIAPAYAG